MKSYTIITGASSGIGYELANLFAKDKHNLILVARNNDGELIIIDHKSKSKFKNKKELNEYAKQLYLYAYAVKQEYGELPKKLYFNMFRTNELVEIDFDINDYQNAYNWLVSSVNEIENTFDFSPQENEDPFYCLNFCPVKNQCEYINN